MTDKIDRYPDAHGIVDGADDETPAPADPQATGESVTLIPPSAEELRERLGVAGEPLPESDDEEAGESPDAEAPSPRDAPSKSYQTSHWPTSVLPDQGLDEDEDDPDEGGEKALPAGAMERPEAQALTLATIHLPLPAVHVAAIIDALYAALRSKGDPRPLITKAFGARNLGTEPDQWISANDDGDLWLELR